MSDQRCRCLRRAPRSSATPTSNKPIPVSVVTLLGGARRVRAAAPLAAEGKIQLALAQPARQVDSPATRWHQLAGLATASATKPISAKSVQRSRRVKVASTVVAAPPAAADDGRNHPAVTNVRTKSCARSNSHADRRFSLSRSFSCIAHRRRELGRHSTPRASERPPDGRPLGRSSSIGSPIARVSLTSSDVADALVTRAEPSCCINGKTPGTISMFVWDRGGAHSPL